MGAYLLRLKEKGLTHLQILDRYRSGHADWSSEEPGAPEYDRRREDEIDCMKMSVRHFKRKLKAAVQRSEDITSQ